MAHPGNTQGHPAAVTSSGQVKKVYIGNINYELDTPDLIKLFEKFGEIIDAVVIKDKETRASRGFGFVTFTSHESAAAAVEEMHNFAIAGRALRVKFAEAKRREANESAYPADNQVYPSIYSQQPTLTYHEFNDS